MQCAFSANGHVLYSFEGFFWWQNKLLSVWKSVVRRFQTGKNDVFCKFWHMQQQDWKKKVAISRKNDDACGWNLHYLEINGIF